MISNSKENSKTKHEDKNLQCNSDNEIMTEKVNEKRILPITTKENLKRTKKKDIFKDLKIISQSDEEEEDIFHLK